MYLGVMDFLKSFCLKIKIRKKTISLLLPFFYITIVILFLNCNGGDNMSLIFENKTASDVPIDVDPESDPPTVPEIIPPRRHRIRTWSLNPTGALRQCLFFPVSFGRTLCISFHNFYNITARSFPCCFQPVGITAGGQLIQPRKAELHINSGQSI